jgi:hypothetical protein
MYTHFVPRGLLAAPPVFGLTSPNGGELWPIDSTVSVRWSTGNLGGNVMIELSRNGVAGPWTTLLSSTANNGLATVTATGPRSTTCRVRISVVGDPAHVDTSAADFTISALQVLLAENFENGAADWTHSSAGGTWVDQWTIGTYRSHSSTHAYYCGSTSTHLYGNLDDARLASPVINNLPAGAVFTYYQWISAEVSGTNADSAYDGGIVEISANGGAFSRIAPLGSYPKTFRFWRNSTGDTATGPMRGQPCFSGPDSVWSQKVFDLSSYVGQSIQLRFRFGSDASTTREGWYVDDVLLYAPQNSVPVVVPSGLTLIYDGSNLLLQWNADANVSYRIYSSPTADGSFTTLEGSTSQTTFTIPGAADDRKFYIVVGWNGQ